MSSESDSKLSELSESAQKFIILDLFFSGAIGITLAILIYFGLQTISEDNKNNKNKYYVYAIKCAKISVIASMLVYLSKIFLMNDIIIGWNLENESHSHFISINDSLVILWYLIGKLSFYYGFTFHIESLVNINNDNQMSKFVKFWMVFVAVILSLLGILYTVDDGISTTKKEIGITPNGFHIVMFSGHDDADLVPYISVTVIVVDSLYFFVLLYRYISHTKKAQSSSNNYSLVAIKEGVKGTVLILFACITFWIFFIAISVDLNIKYFVANIDVIADDICLYLMFKSNQKIYDKLCGCLCNKCCTETIYSSTYDHVSTQISSNEDSDNY